MRLSIKENSWDRLAWQGDSCWI